MNEAAAAAVFANPPYNVPIGGHAQGRGRIKHPDFVVASGEKDEEEFHAFLKNCLAAAACVSRGGAIHYVCMDWRHIETLVSAGRAIYMSIQREAPPGNSASPFGVCRPRFSKSDVKVTLRAVSER